MQSIGIQNSEFQDTFSDNDQYEREIQINKICLNPYDCNINEQDDKLSVQYVQKQTLLQLLMKSKRLVTIDNQKQIKEQMKQREDCAYWINIFNEKQYLEHLYSQFKLSNHVKDVWITINDFNINKNIFFNDIGYNRFNIRKRQIIKKKDLFQVQNTSQININKSQIQEQHTTNEHTLKTQTDNNTTSDKKKNKIQNICPNIEIRQREQSSQQNDRSKSPSQNRKQKSEVSTQNSKEIYKFISKLQQEQKERRQRINQRKKQYEKHQLLIEFQELEKLQKIRQEKREEFKTRLEKHNIQLKERQSQRAESENNFKKFYQKYKQTKPLYSQLQEDFEENEQFQQQMKYIKYQNERKDLKNPLDIDELNTYLKNHVNQRKKSSGELSLKKKQTKSNINKKLNQSSDLGDGEDINSNNDSSQQKRKQSQINSINEINLIHYDNINNLISQDINIKNDETNKISQAEINVKNNHEINDQPSSQSSTKQKNDSQDEIFNKNTQGYLSDYLNEKKEFYDIKNYQNISSQSQINKNIMKNYENETEDQISLSKIIYNSTRTNSPQIKKSQNKLNLSRQKQYSNMVKELFPPKQDERKQYELQNQIEQLSKNQREKQFRQMKLIQQNKSHLQNSNQHFQIQVGNENIQNLNRSVDMDYIKQKNVDQKQQLTYLKQLNKSVEMESIKIKDQQLNSQSNNQILQQKRRQSAIEQQQQDNNKQIKQNQVPLTYIRQQSEQLKNNQVIQLKSQQNNQQSNQTQNINILDQNKGNHESQNKSYHFTNQNNYPLNQNYKDTSRSRNNSERKIQNKIRSKELQHSSLEDLNSIKIQYKQSNKKNNDTEHIMNNNFIEQIQPFQKDYLQQKQFKNNNNQRQIQNNQRQYLSSSPERIQISNQDMKMKKNQNKLNQEILNKIKDDGQNNLHYKNYQRAQDNKNFDKNKIIDDINLSNLNIYSQEDQKVIEYLQDIEMKKIGNNYLEYSRRQIQKKKIQDIQSAQISPKRQIKQSLNELEYHKSNPVSPKQNQKIKYPNYLIHSSRNETDSFLKDWQKDISNKKLSSEEKFKKVIGKTQSIDKRAHQLEQMLKNNKSQFNEEDRFKQKHDLEVHYISSIQAKLALLNNIQKN